MVSGGIAPSFLTSTLDEGERLVSHPDRFTPGERSLRTQLIRGCVGPRPCLDAVE
jgi:hypothetical protein